MFNSVCYLLFLCNSLLYLLAISECLKLNPTAVFLVQFITVATIFIVYNAMFFRKQFELIPGNESKICFSSIRFYQFFFPVTFSCMHDSLLY